MLHVLFIYARLASDIRHIPSTVHSQQPTQIVQPILTRIARLRAHPTLEQLPHADQALIQFFAFVQRDAPPSDGFSLFLLKFIRLFLPHSLSTFECDIVKVIINCFPRGRSCGRYSQPHPVRNTYRMALTISRRSWVAGRPPGSGLGIYGSMIAHSSSVKSLR